MTGLCCTSPSRHQRLCISIMHFLPHLLVTIYLLPALPPLPAPAGSQVCDVPARCEPAHAYNMHLNSTLHTLALQFQQKTKHIAAVVLHMSIPSRPPHLSFWPLTPQQRFCCAAKKRVYQAVSCNIQNGEYSYLLSLAWYRKQSETGVQLKLQ